MQNLIFFLLGKKGYEVLRAAIATCDKHRVRLVVVGADKNVQKDYFNEIVYLCRENNIHYCLRSEVSKIKEKADNSIAIAAGWRWLIKNDFIQLIVFHDSLLPKYRGYNPLVTALLNRDREIGVSAIIANSKFDCGDVVDSRAIRLEYPINIRDAINKISDLYFDLAQSMLITLRTNQFFSGVPQDETMASYSVWRDEEDYRIDWSSSAESIAHFVQCLSFPYKGASTVCNGELIRIVEVQIEPEVLIANRDVGKVLFLIDSKPVVICGAGLLRIISAVDSVGQSVLPFKNFRNRLK